MKKPAYGLNDAPRRWFNVVDAQLRQCGCVPTRGDRCTYVLYSKKDRIAAAKLSKNITFDSGTFDSAALDQLLDPFTGNNSKGFKPCGVICLHVDDLFMVGNSEFENTVIAHLKSKFQIGSEDRNDVTFVGQRIQWKGKPKAPGSFIKVDQKLAIDELREVSFDKHLTDNVVCNPSMHTEYRSVLGQINWLQSRTQYHCCYKFSRCASQQAAPTIGDCRALNKLVRMIKAQPVFLAFHPLKGANRIIGFPDASYKNNEDKSSQRALTIFLAETRSQYDGETSSKGSLVEYESHKITATTMSTTVAELYSLMKCFGTMLYLKGLWADLSGEDAELHLRTDANNLVTTAKTTHQPEQKETIHLIQMLRRESNSGSIDDLAHVISQYCLSDALTKHSAKPDELIKAVETGVLQQVDLHPPFRSLLKHKAFLCQWLCNTLPTTNHPRAIRPQNLITFLGEHIWEEMQSVLYSSSGRR